MWFLLLCWVGFVGLSCWRSGVVFVCLWSSGKGEILEFCVFVLLWWIVEGVEFVWIVEEEIFVLVCRLVV